MYDLSTIQFQSTLSVRRATEQDDDMPLHCDISIHALRKESDRTDSVQTIRSMPSTHGSTEMNQLKLMIHIKSFQALENLTRFLFQVDDC